ncbi:MAG: transposase [Bacilli bacterium]
MATTCDTQAVPAHTVARIMAARWDIENNGFHDLKTYWHMDHNFIHDPIAIRAWLGILVIFGSWRTQSIPTHYMKSTCSIR